jgi:adenosylcobinamide-GDP ribazoletransferase
VMSQPHDGSDPSTSPETGGPTATRTGISANLTSVLVALQFLTTCPPILRRIFLASELGLAVGYFPLIGAGLGVVLAVAAALLGRVFSPGVAAALLLVLWVLITGALHLDGFLDTCDGLFGGLTPDDRLRIMRDERVGGYALAGAILLLLVKYTSLVALAGHAPALILAPVLGRWAMSAGVVLFPYVRPQGLGRDMKDNAHRGQLVMATLVAVAVTWLAAALGGLAVFLLAALATLGLARYVMQRIPGLTGDIYGALCEIVETLTLLAFVATL